MAEEQKRDSGESRGESWESVSPSSFAGKLASNKHHLWARPCPLSFCLHSQGIPASVLLVTPAHCQPQHPLHSIHWGASDIAKPRAGFGFEGCLCYMALDQLPSLSGLLCPHL